MNSEKRLKFIVIILSIILIIVLLLFFYYKNIKITTEQDNNRKDEYIEKDIKFFNESSIKKLTKEEIQILKEESKKLHSNISLKDVYKSWYLFDNNDSNPSNIEISKNSLNEKEIEKYMNKEEIQKNIKENKNINKELNTINNLKVEDKNKAWWVDNSIFNNELKSVKKDYNPESLENKKLLSKEEVQEMILKEKFKHNKKDKLYREDNIKEDTKKEIERIKQMEKNK